MTGKEEYLADILQQLEAFLRTDWPRNLYIENDAIEVYVRQSQRSAVSLPNMFLKCLDIARITVRNGYRRQGLFTDFVNKAHELHPFGMTYLECIQNPLVLQWCIKRGWTPDKPYREEPDCYYLLKTDISTNDATFVSLGTTGD